MFFCWFGRIFCGTTEPVKDGLAHKTADCIIRRSVFRRKPFHPFVIGVIGISDPKRTLTRVEFAVICNKVKFDADMETGSVTIVPMRTVGDGYVDLMLDDIGEEPVVAKDYGRDWPLFQKIVAERYTRMLPMVITTNLNFDQMAERYGERTADRLREIADLMPFANGSFRK